METETAKNISIFIYPDEAATLDALAKHLYPNKHYARSRVVSDALKLLAVTVNSRTQNSPIPYSLQGMRAEHVKGRSKNKG